MEELTKNILINELFDIYGELLSKGQHKMIYLYYLCDLSLSEIAEQENVSRNAVHDALKKGIESLNEFEDKLKLLKKKKLLENKLTNRELQKIQKVLKEKE